MKKFLISCVLVTLISSVTSCAVAKSSNNQLLDNRNTAAELPLASNPDGTISVGLVYAYDQDWIWQITFRSQLNSSAIGPLPAKIYWNVVSTDQAGQTTQLLTKPLQISKDFLLTGQLKTDAQHDVRKVLIHQKNSHILFTDGSSRSLYKISLESVCNMRPSVVNDLTNSNREPCSVSESDFPNICKESETELLQLIKDELITCAIGKQIHSDRGCGVLSCQE